MRPVVVAVSLLIVMVWMAGCSGGGKRKAMPSSNQAAAMAFGRRLLSGVVLPAGSVELHGSPTAALAHPTLSPDSRVNNYVRPARWWRLPLSQEAAVAFFTANQPTGTTLGVTEIGPGGIGPRFMQAVGGIVTSPPPSVQSADLLFDILGVSPTLSEVRATATVTWRPDRPSAEFVPSDCGQVLVAKLQGSAFGQSPGQEPIAGQVAVTDRPTIASWVARINTDPTFWPADHGLTGPFTTYRLTFVCAAPHHSVFVYASPETTTVSVAAGGGFQPLLADHDATLGVEAAQVFAHG